MTWARLDDDFPGHRKIRRLTDGAFRLHITAICYAAHDLTDGFISTDDLVEFASIRQTVKRVAELVESGLWDKVEGGWMIHDYLDYNPSHAQVMAEREGARERKETWKAKRREERNAVPNGVPNGVRNVTPSRTRTRPVPVPTRTSNSPSPNRHLSDASTSETIGLGGEA